MTETPIYRLATNEKPARAALGESVLALGTGADGIHVALCVVTPDKQRTLVIDGARGPSFDTVFELHADPTGRRFACIGKRGKQQFVYVDGKVSAAADEVTVPQFSADGRVAHTTFAKKTGGALVVDGERRETADYIDRLCFSPDGRHLACAANRGGKRNRSDWRGGSWTVIVDGQPGPAFAQLHNLGYAPDNRLLYVGNDGGTVSADGYSIEGGKELVMHGGVPGPRYDAVNYRGGVGFATAGARVAYIAGEADEVFTVVDGAPQPPRGKHVSEQVFSRDGVRFCAVIDDLLSIDGRAEPKRGELSGLTLGGDHGRVAYIADKGDKRRVIVDGEPGPTFTTRLSTSLVFNRDGRHLAYIGNDGEGLVCYVDGKAMPRDYDNLTGGLSISDQGRVAYQVYRARKQQWIIDGVAMPPADQGLGFYGDATFTPGSSQRQAIAWSPDSAHHAYAAKLGKAAIVVIDGVPLATKLDDVLALGWYDRERCFVALARRKTDYLLVRSDVMA